MDIEKLNSLKVSELRSLLSDRGLQTSGIKSALVSRLRDYQASRGAMQDPHDSILPDDSVSQGGKSTSSSTARALAAAKKAGLKAKLESFQQGEILRAEKESMESKLRLHELQTEYNVAEAEEEVLAEFESAEVFPVTSKTVKPVISASSDFQAAAWEFATVPEVYPSSSTMTTTPIISRSSEYHALMFTSAASVSTVAAPSVSIAATPSVSTSATVSASTSAAVSAAFNPVISSHPPDVRPKVYASSFSTTPTQRQQPELTQVTSNARTVPQLQFSSFIRPSAATSVNNIYTSTVYSRPQLSSTLNPAASVYQPPVHAYYSTVNTPRPENDVSYVQRQMFDILSLPKPELSSFDGDPINFHFFMKSFDTCVHSTSISDASKLNRLFELCKGKALKVIKSCALMDPAVGYAKARSLLTERFGNDYVISEAWVSKIINGPAVKKNNTESLQEFSDEVRSCTETLRAMGRLDEVDSRVRLVKLMGRLPYFLQSRWRKQAIEEHDRTGIYPGIDFFLHFLEKVTREISDPVFGIQENKNFVKRNRSSSFHVNAKAENESSTNRSTEFKPVNDCVACGQKHMLYQCDTFKKMSAVQRLKFAKEKRLCFNCLKVAKHSALKCKLDRKCGIDDCEMKHSRFLHNAFKHQSTAAENTSPQVPETSRDNDAKRDDSAVYSTQAKVHGTSKISLPIVPVYVTDIDNNVSIKSYALLDSGSNKTFCSTDILRDLGIQGKPTSLNISTINDGKEVSVKEVKLLVSNVRKRRAIELPKVYALDNFPSLVSSIACSTDVSQWDHLKDLPVCDEDGIKVSLLIGQDNPQALLPLELRHGSVGEPYGVRTPLGWTINGPVDTAPEDVQGVCNFVNCANDVKRLENQIEQFWKIENSSSIATELSLNDKKALQIWDNSIHLRDGHYELDVPFKSETPQLPDNKSVAVRRLAYLGRRLSKDDRLLMRYKTEIDALIDKGYAEKVPDPEGPIGLTWYIPHHAVLNVNKPDKVRIVYDCAAEFCGTSINKEVLQGPDLTNKLIGVLLRFREQKYGMMADIEAMFYQVKVTPHHRDALRFLWWQDGDPEKPTEIYRMTVHLFGGVWCPSISSYALKKTAEEFQDRFDKRSVDAVLRNFYVDDLLQSIDSEDDGIFLAKELRSLLLLRGFNLTKWMSNSRKIIESIPKSNRAKGVQNLDLQQSDLPVERALGVEWATEDDVFRIKVKQKVPVYTRRGLLSVVSSVYDPLGIVCPYVLIAKKLFQKECKLRKGWDDNLEDSTITAFNTWLRALELLRKLQIPRCFVANVSGEIKMVQLHHFCDASTDAYGTVSYLRIIDNSDDIQCSFLFGKSRLAPIKQISIPRLELCAAVTAVQVNNMIMRELDMKIDETFYWSDSTIVLAYINNSDTRFHTFVANRLTVIHEGSNTDQWRYVSSADNPADDASRGLQADRMNGRWLQGPLFLYKSENEWPKHPDVSRQLENDPEVKQTVSFCTAESPDETTIDKILHRFSDFIDLKRSVAWILRFLVWLKDKKKPQSHFLSVQEITDAENSIVRYVQKSVYNKEIKDIEKYGIVSKTSALYNLEPVLIDNVLRVGGRLQHADIPENSKNQVILPRDHFVSTLIVRYIHEVKARHCGTEYVLSLLRTKYWIPKVRSLIRKLLRNCVVCKKLYGCTKNQRMSNLPAERVTAGKPAFTNIGIDCFGPFLVKRGRSQEKRYGCIFTCLAIRAIHIELLHSLDADSFINALIRFISRRGVPQIIRSDNGTNFVGGSRELLEAMRRWNESHKVHEHLQHDLIEWKFNPPAASHMGGVWERQIRTVRKVMNAILRNSVLDDERLQTVFCEVESIVNNRPITKCSDGPNDIDPLTPNHLLLLRGNSNVPADRFVKTDIYNRRWRHVQFLADAFWRRWIREYLPTIQHRQKWLQTNRDFRIGDIVLVTDEATPRNCWPMGRISHVNIGRDGHVRSAMVKTKSSVITRPVNKLCLLECYDQ